LYEFQQIPQERDLCYVVSRNCAQVLIQQDHAAEKLVARAERLLFRRGFFRIRRLRIFARPVAEIHVPYWVGFRGRNEKVHFMVLDAVRRRIQGGKVRQMLHDWLNSAR
jgi:hypothetical protein